MIRPQCRTEVYAHAQINVAPPTVIMLTSALRLLDVVHQYIVISLVGLPTSVLVMDVEGEEKDRGKKRVRTKGIQKKLLEQVGASNIS